MSNVLRHANGIAIPAVNIAPYLQDEGWETAPHSITERRNSTTSETAAELSGLLPSVLDRAFSGRL